MHSLLLALALPCVGWSIAVLVLGVLSTMMGVRIRVNMLCATGVLVSAIGVGLSWEYGRGDVGMSSGWPLMALLGCYISLVTPMGGFVQLITLLADVGVAYDMGMRVTDGAGFLVLAVIGSVVVLFSILPIGTNLSPRDKHASAGRLLTVWKAPGASTKASQRNEKQ